MTERDTRSPHVSHDRRTAPRGPRPPSAVAARDGRAQRRLASALERLAGTAEALQGLGDSARHLERLAALGERVGDLVDTEQFRAELDRVLDTVHAIAGTVSGLQDLPARVAGVDASVGARLGAVEPDIRALTGLVTVLDESIRAPTAPPERSPRSRGTGEMTHVPPCGLRPG